MTSPHEIEDGQQPEVYIAYLFKKGHWSVVVTFKRSTNDNTWAAHLAPASLEEGVNEVKALLDKHGIK